MGSEFGNIEIQSTKKLFNKTNNSKKGFRIRGYYEKEMMRYKNSLGSLGNEEEDESEIQNLRS